VMSMKFSVPFAAAALVATASSAANAQALVSTAAPTSAFTPSAPPTPTGSEPPIASDGPIPAAAAPEDGKQAPAGAKQDDTATSTDAEGDAKAVKDRSPFRGSVFLFDQSIFTSDLSKGGQQSYSPLYEWWLSPRVYYTFGEHVRLGARFDFFKEIGTNHEETTQAREWRVGDPWLTLGYSSKAAFLNSNPRSRWSVGAVGRPPLSIESRANGQYFAAGPNAALTYGIDLNKHSKFFTGMSIGVSASYSHTFSQSTTPQPLGGGFGRETMTTSGAVELSHQLRGGTLAGNSLIYALNADLDIHEKVSFASSFIVIDQFSYAPPDATVAGVAVPHGANDTRFRQLYWFLLDLDYSILPEVSLSLGYYNLAGAIGPDGTRRNVLWSPESRLFFSITANLDVLYDTVTGRKSATRATASATPPGLLQ
jgi:hypothetical protein